MERHADVGLAATTLEAMVTRQHRSPRTLEDVSLTLGGSIRTAENADELTVALGPKSVLGRIGDYRSRVAELLVRRRRRVRARVSAVVDRQGLSRARHRHAWIPGALFERLPAPSSEVLDTVQRSLHQLVELEASLCGLRCSARASRASRRAGREIPALRRERATLDRHELRLRETELAVRVRVRTRARTCRAGSLRGRARGGRECAARAEALASPTSGDAAVWARDLGAAEREAATRGGTSSRATTRCGRSQWRGATLRSPRGTPRDGSSMARSEKRETRRGAAIEEASRLLPAPGLAALLLQTHRAMT